MNREKQNLLDFCQGFSQLTMKYFLERNEVKSSNFYKGEVSKTKLIDLKDDIIQKIEELEIKYNIT